MAAGGRRCSRNSPPTMVECDRYGGGSNRSSFYLVQSNLTGVAYKDNILQHLELTVMLAIGPGARTTTRDLTGSTKSTAWSGLISTSESHWTSVWCLVPVTHRQPQQQLVSVSCTTSAAVAGYSSKGCQNIGSVHEITGPCLHSGNGERTEYWLSFSLISHISENTGYVSPSSNSC